jgi:Zn ribbon nucleic-acid-binding protein
MSLFSLCRDCLLVSSSIPASRIDDALLGWSQDSVVLFGECVHCGRQGEVMPSSLPKHPNSIGHPHPPKQLIEEYLRYQGFNTLEVRTLHGNLIFGMRAAGRRYELHIARVWLDANKRQSLPRRLDQLHVLQFLQAAKRLT